MRFMMRPLSRQQQRLAAIAVIALVLVIVVDGALRTRAARAAWPVVERELMAASAHAGFAVRAVDVEGRDRASAAAILTALHVTRGTPILAIDPVAARARLQQVPWVKTASVYRRLPDTLFIRLTEQRPLAFWQRNDRLVLIDRHGHPIETRDLTPFARLPVLVGNDAPAHAPALMALLASEPQLARRVTAAIRVGARRWNVEFADGVAVALPEDNAEAAWHHLARIEKQHRILERQVLLVDLRLPDRVYLKLPPGVIKPADKKARRHAGKPA